MNFVVFGFKNAFRNLTRSFSIVIILGLSIGLSLVMLLAHQAVGQKINDVESSIGNTVTISPAGFSAFSQANNSLTTSQLNKVKSIAHITSVSETLTDRLTTNGSQTPSFGPFSKGNSSSKTSLKSPVKLNSNRAGHRLFVSGGTSSISSNFSPPVSIVGTSTPTNLNGSALDIVSGTTISGSSNTNQAMVSQAMANKNNLKLGSTFTAYGKTLNVTAIFKSSNQGVDNNVIVSLPTEQRLSGQSGDVTGAVATVNSINNLGYTTNKIKSALGSAADVTSSQTQANNTIKPLKNVQNISLISLVGAIVAGSIIILLTMIMIVRERRREIGILKAIGASNTRVILQFVSEAVTLTILGAVIGIIIGVIGGNPVTNTLVSSSNNTTSQTANNHTAPDTAGGQHFVGTKPRGGFFQRGASDFSNSIRNIDVNVGWGVLLDGLGAAILIAIIGSSLAGWMIAKVRPSEVMRAE